MTKLIQPLSTMVPIVDEDGKPTAQFARTLQRLAVSSNLSVTNGKIDIAAIAAHMVMANKTAGSAAPTACTISDILDFLTTTRGSILFRGTSGWQALAPGTALQVLQTNGPGADPTWVAASGGGGASYEGFGNLLSIAGLTGIPSASANLTRTDGTKAHKYLWTASGANTVQGATTAAPATPWKLHLRFIPGPTVFGVNVQFGLLIRNSTSGKLTILTFNSNTSLSIQEWTNPTTFSSTLSATTINGIANVPLWLRLSNDGTTLGFDYSFNGIDWVSLTTRTLAAFMSSVDQIGLGGVPQSAGTAFVSNFGTTVPV